MTASAAPARRPRVLLVQHGETTGPGTLAEWLTGAGVDFDVVRPFAGDEVPAALGKGDNDYSALIVLGGTMGAYDDEDGRPQAPWLPAVKELLRRSVERSVPTLGICLGGQLLADACGGAVRRGVNGPEIGARLVAKRDVAADDPLFGPVPFTPVVVQWHSDEIFELPPGAVLLATSPMYANQAFRVGDRAWGLQFHIETPPEMVRTWAENTAVELGGVGIDAHRAADQTVAELAEVEEVWRPVISRFADLAR